MKKFTLTLCLWLTFSMSFSQDDQDYSNGNQYVISRYDGGEYIGEIISDDGREILIITQSIGKIYIRKSMISSIKKIENGEIIIISEKGMESIRPFPKVAERPCIFERIYFSRPDSMLGGNTVYS